MTAQSAEMTAQSAEIILHGCKLMADDLKFLRPFISILCIVFTLFALVFLQMEERRISYSVLKQTREFKKELQKLKVKEIEVAHAFRPQHVESIARDRLTMKKVSPSQIIRLNPNYALNENKNH